MRKTCPSTCALLSDLARRYAKAGLWQPEQIEIQDLVGNQRFAGVNDFGWRLHIDNPLEDLYPPRYVPYSISLTLRAGKLECHEYRYCTDGRTRSVQYLTVSHLLVEDRVMPPRGGVYSRLIIDKADIYTGGLQEYGYPGLEDAGSACDIPEYTAIYGEIPPSSLCLRATTEHLITHFRETANYAVSTISLEDLAMNIGGATFKARHIKPKQFGNCGDSCAYARDGVCSDGGPDSVAYSLDSQRTCALGSDCADCGSRASPEELTWVPVVTNEPDRIPPELDLNRIKASD